MATNIIEIRNSLLGGGGGAASPTQGLLGAANGDQSKAAKAQQDTAKGVKNLSKDGMWKKVGKTLGVSFGIATLLKQSQVFTSTFGILFQMIGAIADVILAPALPYVIKAILPLFKLGMNMGKGIGMILKMLIEGLVGLFKLVDIGLTKVFGSFWEKFKAGVSYVLDGGWAIKLAEKLPEVLKGGTIYLMKEGWKLMIQAIEWLISKLPKFMGGKGSDSPPPKGYGEDVAKSIVKWVVPAVLPEMSSAERKEVVRSSLGITKADIASVAGSDSEIESQRQISKYGFSSGIPDRILDGIKMDADMIAAMKMNSTGYGSGHNTM